MSSCSDGKKLDGILVFGSNRNEQFDSFILENGKIKLLERASDPSISPDGKLIVCRKNGGKEQIEFGLYILDRNATVKDFIPTEGLPFENKWIGDNIYFGMMALDNIRDKDAIWRYNFKSKKHEKVFEFGDENSITTFDVSPDEKFIVFSVEASSGARRSRGTYLFDINSKKLVKIDRGIDCAWYPDGSKNVLCIMFPEKDKHEFGTYWGHFTKYNIETGEKEYLALVPSIYTSGLNITKDGKYLFYSDKPSIYRAPMGDLSKRERITEPSMIRSGWSTDTDPDWHQDG